MPYIDTTEFEKGINAKLDTRTYQKLRNCALSYEILSKTEYDKWLITIYNELINLYDHPESCAGPHRRFVWENGWENSIDSGNNIPGYFGKYPVVRWMRELIQPQNINFEYDIFTILQYWLFGRYMSTAKSIYEFGCGTGHNLPRVREINPTAIIYGLDWAESACELVIKNGFKSHKFDMFQPDDFILDQNSVVYTVASMEQLGDNFMKFVAYLLQQKPALVLHIEPIIELLDPTNLLDYFSIQYCLFRNYLNGYLPYLKHLESKGKIEILQVQRTYIGSLFIDGYSVIVWRPL
jgi:hypothetical protein